MQEQGWQAILTRFKHHVEAKTQGCISFKHLV
ncbi:MAG: hypothetical protein RLZZ141_635 [Pseudomonadota bacterium]